MRWMGDGDGRKTRKYIFNAAYRENGQRDYIKKGLINAENSDFILISDVDEILKSGADKIAINTQAFKNKNFIKDLVDKYGSQQIVISVDYKKDKNDLFSFSDSGKVNTEIKLFGSFKKLTRIF